LKKNRREKAQQRHQRLKKEPSQFYEGNKKKRKYRTKLPIKPAPRVQPSPGKKEERKGLIEPGEKLLLTRRET